MGREGLHGRLEDSFGSGRIYIWKKTAALVPEHLWFGGGPDTLEKLHAVRIKRTLENKQIEQDSILAGSVLALGHKSCTSISVTT